MTDRRLLRTRAKVKAALIALALEKGYDEVTIDDLLTRAEVARGTFYSHYADKDAVLDAVTSETLKALEVATFKAIRVHWPHYSNYPMEEFCRTAQTYRDTFVLVLRGEGHGKAFRNWLARFVRIGAKGIRQRNVALGRKPRLPYELIATSFAWQTMAVMQWWFEEEPDREPEEVARMMRQINMLGEAWARNLDVSELGID